MQSFRLSLPRWVYISAGLVFVVNGQAQAENGCPNGYEPWKIPVESSSDCVPIADYGHSGPRAPTGNSSAQWHSFSAAVAWGYVNDRIEFVGVGKYVDEQKAREAVLDYCLAQSWTDCEVAASITNGVITMARDSKGRLLPAWATNKKQAEKLLLTKCKAAGTTCKVIATFDGRPEYH